MAETNSVLYRKFKQCLDKKSPETEPLLPVTQPDNTSLSSSSSSSSPSTPTDENQQIPPHSPRSSNTPSWWRYLPSPVQDYIVIHKWYFFFGIMVSTILILVALFYTGNVAMMPIVLKTSICFLLSSYFDRYCKASVVGGGNDIVFLQ